MSYSEFSSMSAGELIFVIATALLLAILCYCTVPVILRFTLIKRKKLSKRALIGIAITNSIIVFLAIFTADFIIYGPSSDDNNSATPMLLYAFVNYWILSSGNNKYHNPTAKQAPNYVRVYNNSPASNAAPGANQTASSALHKDTGNNDTNQQEEEQTEQNAQDPAMNTTNEAIIAGKNTVAGNVRPDKNITDNPKRKSTDKITVILGCLCVILLFITTASLIHIYELAHENDSNLASYKEAAAYYDEATVIIDADNDKTYYHRINCPTFDDEYSYITTNDITAESENYSKCPICFQDDIDTYIIENF